MKKIALLAIILFSCYTAGLAQETKTISLNEAVDIALKNNFQLKVAKNNVKLADSRVTGEKADFFPSLSGNARFQKSVGNQFIPGTNEFTTQAFSSYNASLSSNLTLFSGFANIRSLRNAKYNKKTQQQNVDWTKETIIFKTATRFLQVLLNKELLEIAKENLQASLKTLEQVKIQTDVGTRPIVDLYTQKSTVANNRLQVTNQKNALELSRLELVRMLQIDPTKEYDFVVPEVEVQNVVPKDYDLQHLVSVALENRSDLQSAKYNIKALKWQLQATKSRYWPTVSLGASLSSSYTPALGNLNFNDQFFDYQINKSFGISLRIPIFNNFNVRTSVQSAKINYKNAQISLQDTRLQVIQEVKQAYSDYQAVLERLKATRTALQAAKKAFKAEQARYEVGAGTLIQLTEAQAQYIEAQSNRAQAVYNFVFQKRLLDYYLGKLDKNISIN